MALIVEDGSIVPGANTFVTVAEVRVYGADRGAALPAEDTEGDDALAVAIIQATDYLEGLRDQYKGTKVEAVQALQYPRYGVTIDGFALDPSAIPTILKSAQCQLAIEATNGLDLLPTGDGREVLRERVDVIDTTYGAGAGSPQPTLEKVDKLLAPLLQNSQGVTTYRA